MASIYNDLKNSGQTFLYVFISPSAKLPAEIMQKRVAQLAQLSEMYAKDSSYTPSQMIDLIRQGIVETYGKQPELILQIIFDNAVRINKAAGIGNYVSDGLTYDPESNQYYDGSGNAFILDNSGRAVEKNGQTSDLTIQNPSNIEQINVGSPDSDSTFWKDVQGVIDWLVGLLQKLGIGINNSKVASYAPTTSGWDKVQAGMLPTGLTDYLPVILGAGVILYLFTKAEDSKPTKKSATQKKQ